MRMIYNTTDMASLRDVTARARRVIESIEGVAVTSCDLDTGLIAIRVESSGCLIGSRVWVIAGVPLFEMMRGPINFAWIRSEADDEKIGTVVRRAMESVPVAAPHCDCGGRPGCDRCDRRME